MGRGLGPGPLVVCVPTTDRAFRAAVAAVLDELAEATPAELERGVRVVYPRARIRTRDLTGEPIETWYAYRDGSYGPVIATAWIDQPGVAWARFDPGTGAIRAANDEMIGLFRPSDGVLVGHFAHEFIPPGAEAISARQLRAVGEAAETASIGLARRGDGESFVVEFVARPVAGGIEAWYRAVEAVGGDVIAGPRR